MNGQNKVTSGGPEVTEITGTVNSDQEWVCKVSHIMVSID